tara:strand:+ start:4625 stop:5038 length:414 start_codon:yes stop_codon:yes gene_type:complete
MTVLYFIMCFVYGFCAGFWTLLVLIRRDKRMSDEQEIDGNEVVVVKGQAFELGAVVATSALQERLGDKAHRLLPKIIARHSAGDWGDVCEEDAKINEAALKNDCQLMSVYKIDDSLSVWAITEADRSSTTLLLPEDY